MTAIEPGESIHDEAGRLLPQLVELRRRLHRRPETGLFLPETQAAIVAALEGLGLEVSLGTACSSVVAVLRGGRPGPSVLLRADMDALALAEETGLPYASQNGAMHACGHDLHVAALVGAARLLSASRARIAGSVVLMFQPGEEAGGGAPVMIEEGVLSAAGPRVEAAYGIHVMPGERGVFSTRPGPLMASANVLRARVHGRGGHGSRPYQAVDPVPALAEAVLALQAYVTRRFDVFDPVVLTVTKLSAGDVLNVIPESAALAATVRTLSDASVKRLAAELPGLVEGIAAAHGCTADVEFETVYPVTVNDTGAAERALSTLASLFGDDRVERADRPMMASEDFSFVLKEVPGAFVFLGTTPPGTPQERVEMNHSPRAVFDDAVLGDQAAALVALALAHVGA